MRRAIMPFKCNKCGEVFEVDLANDEALDNMKCPKCGNDADDGFQMV